MATRLGSTSTLAGYLGTTAINKMYLGSTVVFDNSGDVTAPVINTFSYAAATQAVTLDITEASGSSTVVWATSDTGVTPTYTRAGGWAGGANYETGSFTATSGGDTDVISITGTTPDGSRKLTIYAYDADDNLSAADSVTITVDNTAPALSSAVLAADGVTLTLTYTETLAGTADAADYTVEADAAGVTVSTATRTGSTVVLDLAAAIDSGETVTVSYDGTVIEDANGNAAASLTDQAVTNNSTQGGGASNVVPTAVSECTEPLAWVVPANVAISSGVMSLTGPSNTVWSNKFTYFTPVTAGTTYAFSVEVKNLTTGGRFRFQHDYYDGPTSGDSKLGETDRLGGSTVMAAGNGVLGDGSATWQFTPPAGATHLQLVVQTIDSGIVLDLDNFSVVAV